MIPREEILRMARESCAPEWWDEAGGFHMGLDLMRFAALVAAEEREACAKVCTPAALLDAVTLYEAAAIRKCATAIRAKIKEIQG